MAKARRACAHVPPGSFKPGQAVPLTLALTPGEDAASIRHVRLRYRHVNQAERWMAVEAGRRNETFLTAIPADYTDSPFSLQYYFELEDAKGHAWMYPGFNQTLSNQPYFVVSKRV